MNYKFISGSQRIPRDLKAKADEMHVKLLVGGKWVAGHQS